MGDNEYQRKAKLIVDEVLKNSLNQVRKESEEQMAKDLNVTEEVAPAVQKGMDGKDGPIVLESVIPQKAKKPKKNVLERLLDSILGRDKNKKTLSKYGTDVDGSGGLVKEDLEKRQAKKSRKSRRGWFRKNVFLCCIKNTATVEPIDD